MKLSICEAFEIVLDSSRQNLCDPEEMPEEYERQTQAIEMVQSDADLR